MLRFAPLLLAVSLCGPVLPAAAQDAAPAPAVAAGIEAAGPDAPALSMPAAELVRRTLQDDILLLQRLLEAQARLAEVNTLLAAAERDPLTLPGHLCPASPAAPHCADLPLTFGSTAP